MLTESLPVSPMLALYAGYGPGGRARKAVAVLQAYVDESIRSVGGKRRTLILAGYINYVDKWLAFSEAWERALATAPALSYCHMVEAEALNGEFRGWSRSQSDQKVLALSAVIAESGAWSFNVLVDFDDFNRHFGSNSPYPWNSPTFMAFIGAIISAAKLSKMEGVNLPVDMIFDENQEVLRPVGAFYQHLKDGLPELISSLMGTQPLFRNDKEVVALQAADMLVWHLNREAVGSADTAPRPAYNNLFPTGRHVSTPMAEPYLARMAKFLKSMKWPNDRSHRAFYKDVLSAIEREDLPL